MYVHAGLCIKSTRKSVRTIEEWMFGEESNGAIYDVPGKLQCSSGIQAEHDFVITDARHVFNGC